MQHVQKSTILRKRNRFTTRGHDAASRQKFFLALRCCAKNIKSGAKRAQRRTLGDNRRSGRLLSAASIIIGSAGKPSY